MKTLNICNYEMPSNIKNVCCIIKDIMKYLQETYGLLEECTLFELKVILNEVLLNAVKHGNKGDEAKCVKISAGITQNNYVFAVVEDEGEGYDYNCLDKKNSLYKECIDVCDMKETGRGILIVKSLCDAVKFNRRGNKIVILKKLFK